MARPHRKSAATRARWPLTTELTSERAEEIQQVLLRLRRQCPVIGDDAVRLRALALVRLDRLREVARAAVVQEEEPLPEAPERRGAELVAAGVALRDAVGEALAHRVHREVAEGLEGRGRARIGRAR